MRDSNLFPIMSLIPYSYFWGFLFLVFFIICVYKSIVVVPQGYGCTVERFGRYYATLKPGLGIILPFIDRVGFWMNLRECCLHIPRQDVISRDNAKVNIDAICFVQIFSVEKAAYAVDQHLDAVINLAMTNVRTVLGSMDLDEALSQREVLNTRLLHVINQATEPWGIRTTRVELRDISPPKELVDAMSEQMKAERYKRAEILTAEGKRSSDILKAEGEKEAALCRADGEKYRAFAQAEAQMRHAEVQAQAIKLIANAINESGIEAAQFRIAEQYTEALRNIGASKNSKVVLMPLEASNLAGSISCIKTFLQETGAGQSHPK